MTIKRYAVLLSCSFAFINFSSVDAKQTPSQDELKSVPGLVYKTHPEYHPNGLHFHSGGEDLHYYPEGKAPDGTWYYSHHNDGRPNYVTDKPEDHPNYSAQH